MKNFFPFYILSSHHPIKITFVQRENIKRGFSPAVRIDTYWTKAQSEAYERLVLSNQPLPNGWRNL